MKAIVNWIVYIATIALLTLLFGNAALGAVPEMLAPLVAFVVVQSIMLRLFFPWIEEGEKCPIK